MFDIAIIGAGPGGYISAIRASQLGASVVLIEKDNVGGTCLNWGCIPSKSVICSAEKYNSAKNLKKFGILAENISFDYLEIDSRKWNTVTKIRKSLELLLKSHKIEIIKGNATIKDNHTVIIENEQTQEINFKHLIIATGAKPSEIKGLKYDHEFIVDSSDILKLNQLPESVLIVGSGAIGIEWARIFDSFGSRVAITELAPRLSPQSDISVSERLERIFKRKRVEFYTNTTISSIEGKTVKLSNDKELNPDLIFVAAGRKADLTQIGLENISIETEKGFIKVDNNLKTNIDNIYAIGDITGKMQLAHCASHQGVCAVENILLGKEGHIDYNCIPAVIYGSPEVASVGMTEQQLQDSNTEYKSSIFPMSAIGKSVVDDEIEGFVKILSTDNKIVGAHIIGAEASSLIQSLTVAIHNKISPNSLKETVFAHPTYSEAIHESILGLDNLSLHLPPQKAK